MMIFLIVLNMVSFGYSFYLHKKYNELKMALDMARAELQTFKEQISDLKKAQKELERPAVKIEQARQLKPSSFMSNPVLELDETKRKSLQPSNHDKPPLGYKAVYDEEGNTTFERSYPTAFVYKFFGSALIIDGNVVVGGMTPKMHSVEVNGEGQVMIDGEFKQIHPDVVEKIRIIAHTQE